jgi:amino-acid N-acetyltransferase
MTRIDAAAALLPIVPAARSDLMGIHWLLQLESLPSVDVTEEALSHFLVCRDRIGVVGLVGLEVYGQSALLRSLVVSSERQGCGLGRRLVEAAEGMARASGVTALYLLTTTAAGFFESAGFRRMDRAEAPAQIRATSQFEHLCPATAVLMIKSCPPDPHSPGQKS